jgi:hypothetical protein
MSTLPSAVAAGVPFPSEPIRARSGLGHFVLLASVTVIAFSPVFLAGFVRWDDHVLITQNPTMNPPTWASLRTWWTTPHEGLYTPVAYTVWGLIASVARGPADLQTGVSLRPFPFHAANLLVHLITAAVVYRLLVRLVGRRWPALAGAMLYALHPVQVESVAHVSGIQGLLCGMFGMSAVLQYTHFAAPDPGDRPRLRYGLAAGLFVCAVLSKPLGVVVPVVAGLVDVFFLRRSWRAAVWSLWPWVVVALPYVVLTKSIQQGKMFDVDVPYWTRPFIAADAVAFYLYKLAFPVRLGLFYGRTPGSVLKHDAIFYMWIVPAGLAVALWQGRERLRPVIGAALIFLAALAPVSGLIRFNSQVYSTVWDHYLYLPMFGVALAAAWAISLPWYREPRRARRVAIACAIVLTALGVRTWLQCRHWHDTHTLFENANWVNSNVMKVP